MAMMSILGFLCCLATVHQAIAFSSELSSQFLQPGLNYPFLEGPRFSPFVQHSNKFWAYDRASNSWKLTDISCLISNGSSWNSRNRRDCHVELIDMQRQEASQKEVHPGGGDDLEVERSAIASELGDLQGSRTDFVGQSANRNSGSIRPPSVNNPMPEFVPRFQGRVSMVRFSDVSLWLTGQSGAIYERFWNGVQWVVIPHDLPAFAGRATAVFSVNRTMVAMSETGILFQLQIDGHGQLLWVNCGPWLPGNIIDSGVSSREVTLRKSGMVSADDSALYFGTTDGSLAELSTLHPIKWANHYHPRGGDIASVADAGTLRPGIIFTISKGGDLYEYDRKARPAWKKHVREGSFMEDLVLAPTRGVPLLGVAGTASVSLFLMTKGHDLVERRFHQNKWRWLMHPGPDDNVKLSFSLGPSLLDIDHNSGKGSQSLFLTSEDGALWEYKLKKLQSKSRLDSEYGMWFDHSYPSQTPLAKSVPGVALGAGRLFFPLTDGRIGELHLPGLGGGQIGPTGGIAAKDKRHFGGFTWSILEAPETEGGNADYCSSSRGPSNCLEGTKDTLPGWQPSGASTESSQRKRSGGKSRVSRRTNTGVASRTDAGKEGDFSPNVSIPLASPWKHGVESLFQLRTMQAERSIFFVGRDGAAFERFFSGEAWLWLKHEHCVPLLGIVGVYSGGVFVLDAENNLFLRERIGSVLHWLNCSGIYGGKKIASGPPWDHGLLGETHPATVEDAIFLVDEDGILMEFLVALRQFVWRDCGHPPRVKVAAILDQETLRYRVVFVVGTDGKLYHFNRVTRQWNFHNQPQHITLSPIPGTVIRPQIQSTKGSLFLRSEDGGLIEFQWDSNEGWKWIEHGLPEPGLYLATSPGPNIGSRRLFVVVSDGRLFSRFWDDGHWAWFDHGHPRPDTVLQAERNVRNLYNSQNIRPDRVEYTEGNPAPLNSMKFGVMDVFVSFNGECQLKIAPVRPTALSQSTVMVVIQDGRVASLKFEEETWKWVSIHDTPTSSCQSSYWASSTPQA